MKRLLIVFLSAGLSLAGLVYGFGASGQRPVSPESCTFVNVEYGRLAEVVNATGVVSAQPAATSKKS